MHPALRSGSRIALSLALGIGGLAACDSSATIYISTPKFLQAQIVSAYPAKKQGDGSWEPVCGEGAADGIITNVVYLSSARGSGDNASTTDFDNSIRPLDVIDTRVVDGRTPDDINLSSPGNFGFQFDCIAPGSAAGTGCEGTTPPANLESSSYVANTPDRSRGHNVLLLIDQSGSVGGLVQDVTFKEMRFPSPLPIRFGDFASDQNAVRSATANQFTGTLNAADRFGALAFGEEIPGGLKVPCSEAINDVAVDLETCFGARNLGIWTNGINALQSSTGGRSNLWRAVETAYDFLVAKNDNQRSNHIIVLADGPDTCRGESATSCEVACNTSDYAALLDKIQNGVNNPNAPRIHVHFIQFESRGYPGRDPRQTEMACVTGGHYQFINSNSFPSAQPQVFLEAMQLAMNNVRVSFMGHWQLAAAVPAYASNAAGGGVPPGVIYGLSGALTVRSSSNMVLSDTTFPFGYGLGAGAPNATSWDRRPTVRKACGGFADCGAGGEPGSCQVVCSPETLVCANGASPVTLPNNVACDAGGSCCDGTCQTTLCAACQ